MRNIELAIYSAVVTLLFLNCSRAYHYVPPNRTIEIIETESYQFGIEEDPGDDAIVKCYYTTDTGLSDSFDVGIHVAKANLHSQRNSNHEARDEYNVITSLGDRSLCQLIVDNVDATGPKTWTLIATVMNQQAIERNLTESVFSIQFFYRPKLLISSGRQILESASFYNHLIPLNDVQLALCELKVGDADLTLSLTSSETPNTFLSPYSVRDEELTKRIKSLGENLCGFRFTNASYEDEVPVDWRLTATDEQGLRYRAIFSTIVTRRNHLRHTTQTAILGSHVIVDCAKDCFREYCTLYNPAGTIVRNKNCTLDIDVLLMEHIGNWTCYCEPENAMETVEYTTEIIEKNFEYISTWQKDKGDYLNIGCRVANNKNRFRSCKMTAPDGRPYNILPTLATARYLTLGTDIDKGLCSLMIKKPLLDREKGDWKCELGAYREIRGAVIKTAEVPMPDYPKHKKVATLLDRPFTVSCEVPYSSAYCRILSPNGTRRTDDLRREATLGKCSFTVESAQPIDNGTWFCMFARDTGLPDEKIQVEVSVAELLSYARSIEVDGGETANLKCSTGGYPVAYCRFISPAGVSYHIPNRRNSSTLSYFGRGIEFGECGVSIANVKSSDYGYWTCVTRLSWEPGSSEVRAQILLNVTPIPMDGTNMAGIGIGIAIGVVVVSSIVGFIAMKRWKRREHAEVEGTSTEQRVATDDDSSSNNSETVFSRGPTIRSYTNPQPVEVELEDASRPHQQ